MDIATLVSLIFSFAVLLAAYIMEGGGSAGMIAKLLSPTAAMIVFGGTFGAVGISYPWQQLKQIPRMLKIIFFPPTDNRQEILDTFLMLANIARKDGLLALEQELAENTYDDFIVSGIQLVIDGTDPEALKLMLETRILNMEDRHERGIAVFEGAGGFAPTMGVLGTVMGMVNVLGEMGNDPSSLGPKIATAFLATLYGIGSANLLWIPMANKLKELSSRESITKQMMIEGIMMLQNGSNPAFIKEQLKGYLDYAAKEKESREGQP